MIFDDHLLRAVERKLSTSMSGSLALAEPISMHEFNPHVVVPMSAKATAVRDAGLHEMAFDCQVCIPGKPITGRVVYTERPAQSAHDKAALVQHALDGLRDMLFSQIAKEEADRLVEK